MRKLIKISALVIATILLLSAIFAGNYFYSESVKRGVEVELHKEATAVNAKAAAEDQTLLAEAKTWFKEQEPDVLEMTSYDDLQLKAQFIENEQPTGRAVILAHGYRKESNDMIWGNLLNFIMIKGSIF
ncbi:hypothetical protein ACLIBG_14250 [Virgibacillus sp. W0181]|uniref:hypothetical protein n=1 Tax=Virgibacillus sp. W0181 TaxID=3391581 RepID=UPI003F455AFC